MIFSIIDVLHFLFCINTIIHLLPEASIWEITRCTNPKIYRKCQSENLPDFIIRNTKKNKCIVYIGTVLSLRNFVGVQEEKCRGAGRNCLSFFMHSMVSHMHPPWWRKTKILLRKKY